MDMLEVIFSKYGKMMLRTNEVAELTGRSESMLVKDRMEGVGAPYIKMGKGHSATVYYPLNELVQWIEEKQIKTA